MVSNDIIKNNEISSDKNNLDNKMIKTISIKEAVNTASLILKQNGVEEHIFEARLILCNILKCDRTALYLKEDLLLKKEDVKYFLEQTHLRGSGFPLQYIIGEQEFMSLRFKVTPSVLIPRADTEVLVEEVIGYASKQASHSDKRLEHGFKILDIGTGSGCISIALAYYVQDALITAVDISAEALKLAQENAQTIGIGKRITFLQSDLFSAIEKTERFDVIVSNPPYITEQEMKELQREVVEHEPIGALYGGIDGLDYYRKIINEAFLYLNKPGALMFEVGYKQAAEVAAMLEEHSFKARIVRDLSGIKRVVIGILQ